MTFSTYAVSEKLASCVTLGLVAIKIPYHRVRLFRRILYWLIGISAVLFFLGEYVLFHQAALPTHPLIWLVIPAMFAFTNLAYLYDMSQNVVFRRSLFDQDCHAYVLVTLMCVVYIGFAVAKYENMPSIRIGIYIVFIALYVFWIARDIWLVSNTEGWERIQHEQNFRFWIGWEVVVLVILVLALAFQLESFDKIFASLLGWIDRTPAIRSEGWVQVIFDLIEYTATQVSAKDLAVALCLFAGACQKYRQSGVRRRYSAENIVPVYEQYIEANKVIGYRVNGRLKNEETERIILDRLQGRIQVLDFGCGNGARLVELKDLLLKLSQKYQRDLFFDAPIGVDAVDLWKSRFARTIKAGFSCDEGKIIFGRNFREKNVRDQLGKVNLVHISNTLYEPEPTAEVVELLKFVPDNAVVVVRGLSPSSYIYPLSLAVCRRGLPPKSAPHMWQATHLSKVVSDCNLHPVSGDSSDVALLSSYSFEVMQIIELDNPVNEDVVKAHVAAVFGLDDSVHLLSDYLRYVKHGGPKRLTNHDLMYFLKKN